ncbi:Diguanylate cyclase, GGDEF domain [Neomoorella glycerini]|uniref:Diguanylate cyclase, GGDEF domain n=1 Tax=Neomoorella glycerini TaxID=55779 RepID=A0A6I5ZV31_9FIRM|nr:diguanylate cyclase [Moorella glycerini]QGP93893.1 Diguanylate cyclase, GGDEF domain [Moorella glycerini]
MRKWEQKRAQEISEYILVTHIVSLLIFLMIVFSFYNLPLGFHLRLYLLFMFIIFAATIIAYTASKLLPRITNLEQPQIDEILLLAVIFPLAFIFLWYSHNFFGAKVLILVPSIIAATSLGKLGGTAAAVVASALLFFLDYRLHNHLPPEIFQTNSLITSVNLLLTWLVGGLMEVERKTRQELLQLADYDQLTGLHNHRYLQEKLALTLQKAAAENLPVSFALLDIDQFKYFNTVYGYQKGDEILANIGQLLGEEIKEPCYAARYGGDEFALIFPGKEKSEAARVTFYIKEKIVSRANISLLENESTPPFKPFTIVVGLASYPADADGISSLVRAAENDLYRGKYSRGDAYLYYSIISEITHLKVKEAFPTLQTLVALINIKDRYTFGHSERVMSYSLALAKKLPLSEEEKDTLRYGAYLHDLGKIEVESAILNKTGFLTAREWEIMKMHTIYGSEIVKPLLFFQDISPIIRSHHENYDGSGYPDGLKGEEIPLPARIVRLADSFDAMTTDRPYKKALTFSQASQELQRYAGSHYDPLLVDLFLEAVKEAYEKRQNYL